MSNELHRMYFMIDAVARRLKTVADEALLKSAGLTTSQVTALRIIVSKGNASPSEIATILGYRKSAMTTMVKRLETAGFVTKQASENDGRGYRLHPTLSGKRAINQLVSAFSSIDQLVGNQLTNQQSKNLTASLEAILNILHRDKMRDHSVRRKTI